MDLSVKSTISLAEVRAISEHALPLLAALDRVRGSRGSATVPLESLPRASAVPLSEARPVLRTMQQRGLVICLDTAGLVYITMCGHRLMDEIRRRGHRGGAAAAEAPAAR